MRATSSVMIYFRGSSKALLLLIVVLVVGAAISIYIFYHKQPQQMNEITSPTSPIRIPQSTTSSIRQSNVPSGWTTYTDPQFHLSFGYPASWGDIYRSGYYTSTSSEKGFFRVSNFLYQTRTSIDDEISIENNTPRRFHPYGSKPVIQKLIIDGQDARLIWPSADGQKDPSLYIECPQSCGIFYMEADKDHIQQIIQTMKFTQ